MVVLTPYLTITARNVAQGKYAEAEPHYVRSLATREKILGSEHRRVADSLNGLAELLRLQVRLEEFHRLYMAFVGDLFSIIGRQLPSTNSLLC